MHHRRRSSLVTLLAESGQAPSMSFQHPALPQATAPAHGAGYYHSREKESVSYFSSLPRLQEASPRSSSSSENLSALSTSSGSGHDWDAFGLSPSTPGTPSKLYPHPPKRSSHQVPSKTGSISALVSSLSSLFASRISHFSPSALRPAGAGTTLLPLPLKAPPNTLPLPRLNRKRTTAIALLTLITLSIWTLFTSSLESPTFIVHRPHSRPHGIGNLGGWKTDRQRPSIPQPPTQPPPSSTIDLTQSEELAALISFLTTLATNTLPPSTDPSVPLDPSAVLPFDLSRFTPEHAHDELEHVAQETWAMHPVVIFGKSRHPATRALKQLMDSYGIDPLPSVFEVDLRHDRELLMPVLRRIVGPDAALSPPSLDDEDEQERKRALESGVRLPMLFVGGEFISQRDLASFVESGELLGKIKVTGARTGIRRKGKKGH